MTVEEEFLEIEKMEERANKLSSEISELLILQLNSKYDKTINLDGVSEKIEFKRNELLDLRAAIKVARMEMGGEYDRYKANKRKQRFS